MHCKQPAAHFVDSQEHLRGAVLGPRHSVSKGATACDFVRRSPPNRKIVERVLSNFHVAHPRCKPSNWFSRLKYQHGNGTANLRSITPTDDGFH
jgi:hypothetical protein